MGQQISASQKRVLIIDSNTFAAESLAFLLHCHGHVTTTACSGGDGISSAIDFCPDVVLFDIGVSEVSGIDVAESVRSIRGLRNILIIALTSDSGLQGNNLADAINLQVIKTDEFSLLRDVIANSRHAIHSCGEAQIWLANDNSDPSPHMPY
jgi:CheY-like chemotaxis protein